jgi:GNAT superfamily N-acetyltransferase
MTFYLYQVTITKVNQLTHTFDTSLIQKGRTIGAPHHWEEIMEKEAAFQSGQELYIFAMGRCEVIQCGKSNATSWVNEPREVFCDSRSCVCSSRSRVRPQPGSAPGHWYTVMARSKKMIVTAQNWITVSIEQHGKKTMVFVAENEQGERLGFATVSHSTHFTGESQAYIGELAASKAAEKRGVGKALAQACEQWAREQGYRILSLATGAANEQALGFYRHIGYLDEDITLVRLL